MATSVQSVCARMSVCANVSLGEVERENANDYKELFISILLRPQC